MTISGYSNAVVNVMLGWLKGFANWVLKLFNLAGRSSTSPLLWLSHNWLKLLIFFLVVGIVLDRLIWLVRWRPYWVWFRKERVIVNDEKFLSGEDPDADWDEDLEENWDERDYVVASTLVKRHDGRRSRGAVVLDGSRKSRQSRPDTSRKSAKVKRHVSADESRVRRGTKISRVRPSDEARARRSRQAEIGRSGKVPDDVFGMDLSNSDVADSYEDEVFNVSNLPSSGEYKRKRKRAR